MSFFPTWRENPLFTVMLLLVCFSIVTFLGVKTFLLHHPSPTEHTIFVEGLGKAVMKPDIAVMQFGITTERKSVAEAQKLNSTQMNVLIAKTKEAGVADEDIQTKNYTAYEKTEWNQETQKSVSTGWVVSQLLSVKIRDIQKISTIVEIAGQNGSTNISGPTFTIDDQSAYEAIAREKALVDAKIKVDSIGKSLGFKIDRVVSYSEYKEDFEGPSVYSEMKGIGGAMPAAPDIQSGTQELRLHVTVTYLLSN